MLDRNSSSSAYRNLLSGLAGPSLRLFRLVRQPCVCGNQKNSKCSLSAVSSSSLPMTSSHCIGSSRASSKNAGTTANVTAVSTPSAPRPTLAAANMSGFCCAEHDAIVPSASTISRPATCAAMPPVSRPVPCVPVWMAPATVWTWMSPMFASASPCRSSSSFSTRSGQPASAVTRPAEASTDRMPAIPPGRSMMPSVTAAGVNEWPVPVIRTVRP